MFDLTTTARQCTTARLFPSIVEAGSEKKIGGIFLSLLPMIPALAEGVMNATGVKMVKRSKVTTFGDQALTFGDLTIVPDGVIVVSNTSTNWSALVRARSGKPDDEETVKRFRDAAIAGGMDAVIILSNQIILADADQMSLDKASGVTVHHLSYTWLRTLCEVLSHQDVITSPEQEFMLAEFIRLLADPVSNVLGFAQMGPDWKDLVQAAGGTDALVSDSVGIKVAVTDWHSECEDLGFQLSRHIGMTADVRVDRKHISDPGLRASSTLRDLMETRSLTTHIAVPGVASDIRITADLAQKNLSVAMQIPAPLDCRTVSARVTWVLGMVKDVDPRLTLRAFWPDGKTVTDVEIAALHNNPDLINPDNLDSLPTLFEIILIEKSGARFASRRKVVEDLERILPEFYDMVAQHLVPWQATPPKPVHARVVIDAEVVAPKASVRKPYAKRKVAITEDVTSNDGAADLVGSEVTPLHDVAAVVSVTGSTNVDGASEVEVTLPEAAVEEVSPSEIVGDDVIADPVLAPDEIHQSGDDASGYQILDGSEDDVVIAEPDHTSDEMHQLGSEASGYQILDGGCDDAMNASDDGDLMTDLAVMHEMSDEDQAPGLEVEDDGADPYLAWDLESDADGTSSSDVASETPADEGDGMDIHMILDEILRETEPA